MAPSAKEADQFERQILDYAAEHELTEPYGARTFHEGKYRPVLWREDGKHVTALLEWIAKVQPKSVRYEVNESDLERDIWHIRAVFTLFDQLVVFTVHTSQKLEHDLIGGTNKKALEILAKVESPAKELVTASV